MKRQLDSQTHAQVNINFRLIYLHITLESNITKIAAENKLCTTFNSATNENNRM